MTAKDNRIPVRLDKSSFEALFRSFFPGLVLFAQKYVPDRDTAMEIVHNVFLNLWEKRESLDMSTSLKSYLFRSVHNRCLNFIRDQKKFNRDGTLLEKLDNDQFTDASDLLEEQELEQRIFDSLRALPDRCRQIFSMNRFEGMKYAEIAAKLNISVKTVETQMSKALKILREKLIDYLKILILFILTHLN